MQTLQGIRMVHLTPAGYLVTLKRVRQQLRELVWNLLLHQLAVIAASLSHDGEDNNDEEDNDKEEDKADDDGANTATSSSQARMLGGKRARCMGTSAVASSTRRSFRGSRRSCRASAPTWPGMRVPWSTPRRVSSDSASLQARWAAASSRPCTDVTAAVTASAMQGGPTVLASVPVTYSTRSFKRT